MISTFTSAGICLVLCQRSLLPMVVTLRIWTILRGHVLTKLSDPYSKAGLPLKILIFVCSVSSLELQMFFNCKAGNLALPILALTRRLLSPPPPDCILHCPGKRRHSPLPKLRFSTLKTGYFAVYIASQF